MIHIFMPTDIKKDEIEIYLEWLKVNFKEHKPKIHWIKGKTIYEINYNFSLKDSILWHPILAYSNLNFLLQYDSTVVLEKPTILIQKNSANNPITENMAINHGFRIIYINPENIDITNKEYKLVVPDSYFISTIEQILK